MRRAVLRRAVLAGMFLWAGGGLRPTCALAQATATAPDEGAAQADKEEQSWLVLVDAAKWSESWKQASAAFRKAVPEETWVTGVAHVREPLGKLLHRELLSASFSRELPGAPDGQYVVSQYRTVFANKADAMETVVAQVDTDGSWRISGYYVK